MTYAAVDTAYRATRTSGDLTGQIQVGLFKKANNRAINAGEDQREWRLIGQVYNGTIPVAWVQAVMERMDSAGKLAAWVEADIDTAITAVWNKNLAIP